jgi:mRNA interferase RelE/StbE
MGYSVEIISKAEREFLKLPEAVQRKIRKQILSLENDPRPFGSSKLKNSEFHRIRSGDYRVIYSIDDKSKVVRVLSIAHRKEVYR